MHRKFASVGILKKPEDPSEVTVVSDRCASMSATSSNTQSCRDEAKSDSPHGSNNSQFGFDPEATDEANYLRAFGQTRAEMRASMASYVENIRVFRMEEPPRGSRYHPIYRVTALAYRAGDGCPYIPDYERQPDPGDEAGVVSYWDNQLREYTEYLAAGGRPVIPVE